MFGCEMICTYLQQEIFQGTQEPFEVLMYFACILTTGTSVKFPVPGRKLQEVRTIQGWMGHYHGRVCSTKLTGQALQMLKLNFSCSDHSNCKQAMVASGINIRTRYWDFFQC